MSTATTQIIISGKDELSRVVADAGRRLGTELQSMQREVFTLSNVFTALGGAIGGLGLAQMAREVFQAGVAMDALQRSLVAVSGSQAIAASELSFLREESDRLGQSFYDVAPQFKALAAAARDTALEGEQTRKIFSSIMEASAALGLSADQTGGALNALSQMISKGNVQAEELRGQLGERLPGAFQLAAKAMGVSTQQLGKMLEKGEVLAADLLPQLADELHRLYGQAAQTAALESAQAAVNGLSEEWTDLKVNMFHSESAVAGINLVTEAIAGLNAMIGSIQTGKVHWLWDGLEMEALDPSKYRGKVDRSMVMPAYTPPAATVEAPKGQSKSEKAKAERAAKAAAKGYEKMLTDGRRAAAGIDKWGEDYENARVKAIADSVATNQRILEQDLQLVAEFADRFKAVVLGETEFKKAQIDTQAAAYINAGADELAVARFVAAEKLAISRDWQDGATRTLQAYTDNATNTAAAVEDVMAMAFIGMEDMIVDFVKTGKLEFADLVTSINAEIARLAFRSIASEGYEWLGGVVKAGISMASSYLSGGASVAAGSAGGGFNYAGELSHFMSVNAKGGVYDSPSLSAYSGGVYHSPQMFAFARGAGIFAEAGPEAIMPLRRGPDGVLGVKSGGGDEKTYALLSEIAASLKRQKAPKTVVAFDKRTLANELAGSEGEQLVFQHIRRNPATVRRMLGLG